MRAADYESQVASKVFDFEVGRLSTLPHSFLLYPRSRLITLSATIAFQPLAFSFVMDWSDEPATWRQLKSLRDLGYAIERRLTRVEAAEIIRSMGGKSEPAISAVQDRPKVGPLQLRHKVEQSKREMATAGWSKTEKMAHELQTAMAERQQFWADTCQGVTKSELAFVEIPELYQKYGCRFDAPSRADVQYILDALDQAMPTWDKDHPELFFQTLELNFPALVRRPKGL